MLGDIPPVFIFANTNHLIVPRFLFLVETLLEGFLVFGVLILLGFMDVNAIHFLSGKHRHKYGFNHVFSCLTLLSWPLVGCGN